MFNDGKWFTTHSVEQPGLNTYYNFIVRGNSNTLI